jgi:hypothetical protein
MNSIIIVFTILLGKLYEMKRLWFHSLTISSLISTFLVLIFAASPLTGVLAQQPTETPSSGSGMFITNITDTEPYVNVRLGPSSTIYPIVGTIPYGGTAPALGRSQGGDWIQIEFPSAPGGTGWVYSPLVQVSPPGTLRIVESPPTPVPPATSTIDPTLAAQFVVVPTSTRLPTFTPPPPLVTPEYIEAITSNEEATPLASIIMAFAVLGVIGFFLSLLRR